EMTLVVQNQVLSTEIAAIRATATVDADRLIVTLEHAQTAVSQVDGQTQDLQATLGAGGLPPVDLDAMSPVPDSVFATPPPVIDSSADPLSQLSPDGIQPIRITPGATSPVVIPNQNNAALVITPLPAQQETTGP